MGLHLMNVPVPGSIPGGSNKRARSSNGRAACPIKTCHSRLVGKGGGECSRDYMGKLLKLRVRSPGVHKLKSL